GSPIVARVAKKPISTTLEPRRSVHLGTGAPATTKYERSDFCAVPRAVPIGEAMLALVLADALLEKLGGDSMDELKARFDTLRRSHIADLPMNDQRWRFGYDR
ncbi:MAG: chorismate synthase, partial [Polyangiaceae bacterium]|nr:chorismate synthase [Polyangiaceae bacterium]